jgi:hypothetical protein
MAAAEKRPDGAHARNRFSRSNSNQFRSTRTTTLAFRSFEFDLISKHPRGMRVTHLGGPPWDWRMLADAWGY